MALAKQAAPLRGPILYVPLLAAIRSAARKPLAFTIQDIANSLPAGGAAVACQDARRAHGVFVAARPFAQRKAEKKFCCVTTRRRKFWALSDLGRGLGPLAALRSAWVCSALALVLGSSRRLACRCAASQRRTSRRHSGSWQYRWFQRRGWYLRSHPLFRQGRARGGALWLWDGAFL